MKLYKRILKQEFAINTIAALAAFYIYFVYITTRWKKVGYDRPAKLWEEDEPFIVAFWHNRLLMGAFAWRGQKKPFHMLISSHSDGKTIAKVVAHYGIKTIPGSKSKGGIAALKSLLKVLKQGNYIGITPDGPRGPRLEISDGIISLAKLSGCPIVPVTYATSRRKVLGSWDRFIIPLPFSKGVLAWGEPIDVPKKLSAEELEKARQTVLERMLALSDEADAMCGHEPLR